MTTTRDAPRATSEPYSPLRYPGGKARLTAFLVEVMRGNGLLQPHYVEPYAGGAGAALRLLFEEYVESITINDADPRIRCFWQAVTNYNDDFLERLDRVSVNVGEWRKQREIYDRRDLRRILDTGFATFFLNRTTRSGIIHNGGPIGGYDQDGSFPIDARFNRNQLSRRIQRIGSYADRITVSDKDGLVLLREINRSRKSAKRTFVYLDPPYYAKGAELYLNRFTEAQHQSLAGYLSTDKHFVWVMTYDDVPEIRRLYGQLRRRRFRLSYSAYERRQGTELLIYPPGTLVPPRAVRALPLPAGQSSLL